MFAFLIIINSCIFNLSPCDYFFSCFLAVLSSVSFTVSLAYFLSVVLLFYRIFCAMPRMEGNLCPFVFAPDPPMMSRFSLLQFLKISKVNLLSTRGLWFSYSMVLKREALSFFRNYWRGFFENGEIQVSNSTSQSFSWKFEGSFIGDEHLFPELFILLFYIINNA